MAQISGYVGRFAPSPTGPLHAGSLTAALASWVDARSHNGIWLLRIEDIDPPREVAGSSASIVQSLQAHGLLWDQPVTYQSRRSSFYESALDNLRHQQLLYACTCTRKQLRELAAQTGNNAYPGTCRKRQHAETDRALRVVVPQRSQITFDDIVCGQTSETVSEQTGDFIVRRRGSLYAYQLAVVVDDELQNVTHIVRGADLLDNTARQIVLQQALGYRQPRYLHVPLVMSGDRKLSKQTGAPSLDNSTPIENLIACWRYLGQKPVDRGDFRTTDEFLAFAVSEWKRNRIGNVPICS